jgi:hypothetical protein
MDARQLFLMNHAITHATMPTPGATVGREDRLCEGLTEDDLRRCPFERHNSIAWLLWHMARCEDVMVNSVLRDGQEVLDDGWLDRLGVSTRHIGTEDTMAEVDAFSRQVDVVALRRYRAAVAQATRNWVEAVDFSSFDKVLKSAGAERAAQRGAFTERSDWVREMWAAEDRAEIHWLSWLAIGHNHSHIGEGGVTKGLIMKYALIAG